MTFPAMPLYRLVVCLAWPIVALSLLTRVIARRERLADWGQRTGLAPGRGSGPHLWLHAASNGELTSARPALLALHAARPELKFLITCNSLTGRDLALGWGLPGLSARLAPFDTRWAAVLLCRRYGVVGHLLLEAEFWPNRIAAVARRGRGRGPRSPRPGTRRAYLRAYPRSRRSRRRRRPRRRRIARRCPRRPWS